MFDYLKSLMQPRITISLCLVACTALLSFASTKIVFIKFHTQGLLSLGDALNVIGVVMVLSSLSIESGLIRKIIVQQKENAITLKSALMIIYLLGAGLGITYTVLIAPSAYRYVIFTIILYLPFSVLRSYLVATEQQHFSSILMLITSGSTFGAVVFATSATQIFNLIIIVQFIFILMLLIPASYAFRKSISFIDLLIHTLDRSVLSANLTTSAELLRFSFHSMASGFQNNQAMLASRLFLVTFVGVDFAGQMEMYQRPLMWLFVLASTLASLFFYPFVLNKMKTDAFSSERLKVQREILIKLIGYGSSFIIILTVCFPFLYWLTFEYDIISVQLAAFWIGIFSLRFFGVLLSSWVLAKNDVKGAVIGEFILYLPLILVFTLSPGGRMFGLDHISIYFIVVGFSSLLYIVYFIFILKLYLIFTKFW